MKKIISKKSKALAAVSICLVIAGATMSFQNNQYGPLQHYDTMTEVNNTDTLPEKKKQADKLTMKEFNELVKRFEAAMKKATEELSSIRNEKTSAELNASLQKINTDELQASIDKALKEIDFTALEKNIRLAMDAVEWNKLSEEVKISLDKTKAGVENIDMKAFKKELAEAKIEIEKSKAALSKINLDNIVNEAKEGIEKAAAHLRRQKIMFNEMEQDGVVNQQKGFTVEWKDGNLYIDGKQQPGAVQKKYRGYFEDGDYKITIEKE